MVGLAVMVNSPMRISAWFLPWLLTAPLDGSPYAIAPSDRDLVAYYDYDAEAPLEATSEQVYEDLIQVAYEISFLNTRGDRVLGMLWVPKTVVPRKAPVILHMPGYGDDRNELDETTVPFMGGYYTRWTKYALLTLDPPYRGERGRPGHDVLSLDGVDSRDVINQYVLDYRRAMDYLETREDLKPEFHVTTLSFGGFTGPILAAVDARIRAVSVIIGGGDWCAMNEQSLFPMAIATRRALNDHCEAYEPYFVLHDPAAYAHLVSPAPLHVHAGRFDLIAPTGDALFDAAEQPKALFYYPAGHYSSVLFAPSILRRTHTLFDRN
jgi:hypothetical protein